MNAASERMRHPDDWIGEELHGKWRLDELLGVGGVASVYSAMDRHGRQVAVKLMHPHWADEPTVRERFLREGYAANRVKHPAVISAFADGVTEEGLPFLVLELMEGRSLETELMVNGPMPVDQVLDIADQVLDALGAAHDLGILHRDLKPDNLLLLHDGSIRVLDFGIARMRNPAADDPRLTVNGRAMGTPGFMSPEQARGDWDQVDERTDVWSVGATMFALLTGHEVHQADMQHELLVAAMTEPAPKIQDLVPEVPDRVAMVIDRALAFRPEDRWGTAAEMQRNVQTAMALVDSSFRDDAPPTLRPVSTNPQAPRRSQPQRPAKPSAWRVAIVAAASIAAVAALGTHYRENVGALEQQVQRTVAGAPDAKATSQLSAVTAAITRAILDARSEAAVEVIVVDDAPVTVIDLDEPDP
ncbi:MAG TPA: serine/threonine protein kinase [Polyangiaceae bacterium]|nr:serine/threonine protein kinase [Polyangiaceae bacterium]